MLDWILLMYFVWVLVCLVHRHLAILWHSFYGIEAINIDIFYSIIIWGSDWRRGSFPIGGIQGSSAGLTPALLGRGERRPTSVTSTWWTGRGARWKGRLETKIWPVEGSDSVHNPDQLIWRWKVIDPKFQKQPFFASTLLQVEAKSGTVISIELEAYLGRGENLTWRSSSLPFFLKKSWIFSILPVIRLRHFKRWKKCKCFLRKHLKRKHESVSERLQKLVTANGSHGWSARETIPHKVTNR